MASAFKTHWTSNGRPYWVVQVHAGKQDKDGNARPPYCYLRFGGKRYLLQFNESKKEDVAMWLRLTSMSYRAGRGYSYGKRYGYTPF